MKIRDSWWVVAPKTPQDPKFLTHNTTQPQVPNARNNFEKCSFSNRLLIKTIKVKSMNSGDENFRIIDEFFNRKLLGWSL